MSAKTIGTRVAAPALHALPPDVRKVLIASPRAHAAWEDITPLSRNEWVCWITSAKKPETRRHRIERMRAELMAGKRRPCCWPGCPHRSERHPAREG